VQAQTSGKENKIATFRKKINHIIIIYQENWSFDGLYGKFPHANNLLTLDSNKFTQRSINGEILTTVPQPINDKNPDKNFPESLPAKPYSLLNYINPDMRTGDLVHRFYTEQLQIDGGKMDKYAAYTDNSGLVLSYFDAYGLHFPEAELAAQYTLCDNFFHSAFGGSFLNHIFFISAAAPKWGNDLPEKYISQPDTSKEKFKDNILTPDGYAVNTVYSVNTPRPKDKNDSSLLLPYQTMPTIGDRMNDAKVSWAWYSGGWNDALEGKDVHDNFQYHHQPFVYFENYKNGSANKKIHLKDEADFYAALRSGTLPAVSFIKPYGDFNEHPGYASVFAGQQHVDSIIQLIKASKYWKDAIIIIAYDENGGRWDHVAPPKIDKWGPGTRVPAIIISPFAKRNFVDHTQYETVSILKLIETRYKLKPLSTRDAKANDLLNTLHF